MLPIPPENFVDVSFGSLYVRGMNIYGELGVGNDLPVTTKTKVMQDITAWHCYGGLLLALDSKDTLYAAGTWGGFDTIETMQRLPDLKEEDKRIHASYRLTPILENVHSVACDGGTLICVKKDGTVWARGHQYFGLFGIGRSGEGILTEFAQVRFRK